MNRFSRVFAATTLLVAVVGLTTAPTARAQQPRGQAEPIQQQPIFIPGGGTELFRALLDKEGIRPVTTREFFNNGIFPSEDLIVISVGTQTGDSLRWSRMVIQANGAALIASDSWGNLQDAGWNQDIARFNGSHVTADNIDCYNRMRECPLVVPVSPDERLRDGEKPGRVWSVFRGLTRLTTNYPTYIDNLREFRGEYQHPLATLPKSSTTLNGAGFFKPPLFAVGGDGQPPWIGAQGYSFLAVADSSVFINQMVMEPGTDNLEFTLRTIEYLQGPDKARKRCLFFENGRVIEKFDGLRGALQKPKPKIPPDAMPNIGSLFGKHQDKLVTWADNMADKLQTHDWLHETFVGPRGSSRERNRFGHWVEIVAVFLAIGTAFFLLRRSWRARHAMDVPPAPTTGAGAAATGPPGVFDRRQRELVRRNNLYEPVRNLMREFFDSVGAPPNPGPRLPPLEISDEVRKPESLRQAIRDMWRIAYGPPMLITAQRWFELEPYFDRLRKAHADGKWRFITDE